MSSRTNITVLDDDLWKWAKKRAIDFEMTGVSEYIFHLIGEDRKRLGKGPARSSAMKVQTVQSGRADAFDAAQENDHQREG